MILEELGDVEREAIKAEASQRVTEPWPEPYPFDAHALPPFPVDALSPWMCDWAQAEALATQTPVDLPACLALTTSSLAISRAYRLRVRDGWTEPTNLWAVVALPPGERKSVVYADATAPVYAYVQHVTERTELEVVARARDRRILEAKIKDAEAAAVKGKSIGGIDGRTLAAEYEKELTDLPEMHPPVLLTDDCTSEALAVLLSHHDERMGIFSAEGGPLELMAGRYSDRGSNFEIYLKSHPGDPHVVHRISRASISLSRPLLTMALTVQPSVIAGLASKEGFRGRGLLARFLYSLPQTALGARVTDPEPMPPPVSTAYQASVASLLLLRGAADAQRTVTLSHEADALRSSFQSEVEPRLGIDGDLHIIGDWANKLVGSVCRLAGVLHVADHALCLDRLPETVPAPTLARAIGLGRYFLAHALAAFDAMGADPPTELAKRILAWAKRKHKRTLTAREARRATSSSAEDMALALAILLDRSLVRPSPTDPKPGRPSESYDVHPWLFGSNGSATPLSPKPSERERNHHFPLSHQEPAHTAKTAETDLSEAESEDDAF